jgi:hypothetical protein
LHTNTFVYSFLFHFLNCVWFVLERKSFRWSICGFLGWYQGERIRDGERGWFPGNFCEEIASAHVRARNLRQRYRLLVLSGSYLEEKRRITVGKAATFYVPAIADKRRERKTASSVFAPS